MRLLKHNLHKNMIYCKKHTFILYLNFTHSIMNNSILINFNLTR